MPDIESEEVSWKVLDIPICGTVTKPKGGGTHPAVILVAGSGPTDRNWCSPLLPGTNGSGRLFAEALAACGFLTIRYDKMASGSRVKENFPKFAGKISMQTHLEELSGAVEAAIAHEYVDKKKVFALTNSEGAIHAVNYQLQAKSNPLAGFVLTGPPGRSIEDVARAQIFDQLKHIPDAQALMKLYDDAIADFVRGKPISASPMLPESTRLLLRALETPANLPFSRELWNYSLAKFIPGIRAPALIVIGKKDIQVDWQVDGKMLEGATRGMDQVTFAYPQNANHVMKHEEQPREKLAAEYASSRYNSPDAALDKEAADKLISWLGEQCK